MVATKHHTDAERAGRHRPCSCVAKIHQMQQARQKMFAELHVTPDQQAKLKKAQREQRNMGSKMMAIYNNKSLTDNQKKKQMTDISVKSRAQINAIFTPEQRAKYKAMQQAAMQARMKQMQAAGGATTKPSH